MYRRKSISKFVLLALEKAVDGSVRLNDFIYHTGYYNFGGGWEYPLDKSSLSKALKRLRENGLVDFIGDEQLVIRITDKGRDEAVLAALDVENSKWDGRWRIVIFDVPEKRRIARDALRSKLKAWGFTPWQQSVWVTKKDCTRPLRNYINRVGIGDWVMVIESDNVDL